MQISPVTLRVAKAFISRHHRHNKPPVGHKFSIGLRNDAGELIGVATAGIRVYITWESLINLAWSAIRG